MKAFLKGVATIVELLYEKKRLTNTGHLVAAILLFAGGFLCLSGPNINSSLPSSVWRMPLDADAGFFWAALGVIAVVDIYVLWLLILAALLAVESKKGGWFPGLPGQVHSIFIALFLLGALVMAFAHLHVASKGVCNSSELSPAENRTKVCQQQLSEPVDAAYFSLVTITTLGYGDYVPYTGSARGWVMFELGSGMLYLLLAVPVFASRLASFGALTPKERKFKITKRADGKFKIKTIEVEPKEVLIESSVFDSEHTGVMITITTQGEWTKEAIK